MISIFFLKKIDPSHSQILDDLQTQQKWLTLDKLKKTLELLAKE